MANSIRYFQLNTGAKIPSVGLGTFQAGPGQVADAVTAAIKVLFLSSRTEKQAEIDDDLVSKLFGITLRFRIQQTSSNYP